MSRNQERMKLEGRQVGVVQSKFDGLWSVRIRWDDWRGFEHPRKYWTREQAEVLAEKVRQREQIVLGRWKQAHRPVENYAGEAVTAGTEAGGR